MKTAFLLTAGLRGGRTVRAPTGRGCQACVVPLHVGVLAFPYAAPSSPYTPFLHREECERISLSTGPSLQLAPLETHRTKESGRQDCDTVRGLSRHIVFASHVGSTRHVNGRSKERTMMTGPHQACVFRAWDENYLNPSGITTRAPALPPPPPLRSRQAAVQTARSHACRPRHCPQHQ